MAPLVGHAAPATPVAPSVLYLLLLLLANIKVHYMQKKLKVPYVRLLKTLATNKQGLIGVQLKSLTYYMGKAQILH